MTLWTQMFGSLGKATVPADAPTPPGTTELRLVLTRRWVTGDTTMGTLTVDGMPECYTLEDVVRTAQGEDIHDVKVPGETAIPAGTYRVEMDQSPKFGRVPHLRDVPGFTDILIHAGNTVKDTEGCILVGLTRKPSALEQSRVALVELIKKIERAEQHGRPVNLEIREMVA